MSTLLLVRLPHGKTLKKIWLILVLLYAALRALTVDYFLGAYGVRGEVYFAIEIATSIPFARFSAYLVEDIVAGRSWAKNAIVTALSYIAPDIYLLATIHSAPSRVYFWTLSVVAVLSSISLIALRQRIRQSK